MGTFAHPLLWRGNAKLAEKVHRPLCRLVPCDADMGLQRLHNLVAEGRFAERLRAGGRGLSDESVTGLMEAVDSHVGSPDEVIASLRADTTLERATDIAFQVHSMDPPHLHILRSIELTAEIVAPALGWWREAAPVIQLAVAG